MIGGDSFKGLLDSGGVADVDGGRTGIGSE